MTRKICSSATLQFNSTTTLFHLHEPSISYIGSPADILSISELMEQALALLHATIQTSVPEVRESLLFILEEKLFTLASCLKENEVY